MQNTKSLAWGLIGCGDISERRIAPALRDLNNCDLVAVNRANPDLLDAFAREFGAKKTYGHWQQLIKDSDIEAVYLATPVNLHAEMTVRAAEAGKHVLCEKPMAMTDEECEQMINTCRKNQVKLGIAYYRHHYPIIRRIREIIGQGLIGDVMIVQMNAFSQFDRQPGQPRYWLLKKDMSGGGPMMDFGCHRIEVLLYLFGPIRNVRADIVNLRYKRDVEDTAIAYFQFCNEIRGILTVTHTVHEAQDSLDIYGTKGSIHVPVLNESRLIVINESGKKTEDWPPHANLHLPLIDDFTRAVLNHHSPEVTGETGLLVNQILTKIYANTLYKRSPS